MQTRSTTENQTSPVVPTKAAKLRQAMKDRLVTQAKQAAAVAQQDKKREEKRLRKESLVLEKQKLKTSYQSSLYSFLGELPESEAQLKTRLHSHLLTGRHQNRVLSQFALQLFKKGSVQSKLLGADFSHDAAERFRVSKQVFNRAVRQITGLLLKNTPRSILKKRFADLDLAQDDFRVARQIRAQKRNKKNQENLAEIDNSDGTLSAQSRGGMSASDRHAAMAFTSSDSHFYKKVMVHPERDVEIVRVIDQPVPAVTERTQKVSRRSKATPAPKSSLESLDLATENRPLPRNNPRKLQFNDTIEVYYYPENKEQHEHHQQNDDDDDDQNDLDYEESISCDEKLSISERVQEETDPTFEELLYVYLKKQIIPNMFAEQSCFQSMTPQKRLQSRARACSFSSAHQDSSASLLNLINDKTEEAGSDSEKSLSTNENTFPSGPSSAPETGVSSPPHEKRKVSTTSTRYEESNEEICDISNSLVMTQSASPNLHRREILKRQRLTSTSDVVPQTHQHESTATPTKSMVKRCLFP